MTKAPIRILFVCLGNICRSPAAESVFNKLIKEQNLSDYFFVESAGTGGWHIGQEPDARMRRQGEKRGLVFTTLGQQLGKKDFDKFDFIVTMDDSNYQDALLLAGSDQDRKKVVKLASFHSTGTVDKVPDPYYGGVEGFEMVLDILEDACANFLRHVLNFEEHK
jgi:protein-tyrosine phosphatase